MKIKVCRLCKQRKPLSSFHKKVDSKDGHRSNCKTCRKGEHRTDEIKEYRKQYYIKNAEDLKRYSQHYREKNPEKIQSYSKEYYSRDSVLNRKRKYEQDRYKNSIQVRLARILRSRLYDALNGNRKNASAIQNLGCSLEELKLFLENQFLPGMSWDNSGEWHIDHIIPLSAFDLTDKEECKKACHYTNLQPLWAEDNLKKGAST